MKTRRYILVLSVIFLVSCSNNLENKKNQNTLEELKDNSYETETIAFIQPEYSLSLPGELLPFEEVLLYAKVNGFVKEIYVDRGDEVKKGQLLAELEAPEIEQNYLSNKALEETRKSDYLYAKQKYERLKKASEMKGAVAENELDLVRSTMDVAKAAYEAAKSVTQGTEQMQKYLQIRAPFQGVISEKNISGGALVGAGMSQPIFKMAQNDHLRLAVSVPEKHAVSILDSMQVFYKVSSHPGKEFKAQLTRNSKVINRKDRSIQLEFDVLNEDNKFNGGEYAQANLLLKRKDSTFWVNHKSILRTQRGTFVIVKKEKEMRYIPVIEGISIKEKTEVFGNFERGDKILLYPSEEIKEGKKE